jgi:ferrous iron transport protein A
MTLEKAPLNRTLVLVGSSLDATQTRRLSALGLRAGAQLRLVQRLAGGARVVAVAGARVALGASLLDGLTVEAAA